MPAPGEWVVIATYPDHIVWEFYPGSGRTVQTAADYVFGSNGFDHPPYETREHTAVLKRKWEAGAASWRADAWFELHVDGEQVLTLTDQPAEGDALKAWWELVVEVLTRIVNDEPFTEVPAELGLERFASRSADIALGQSEG